MNKQINKAFCVYCKTIKEISEFYLRKNGDPLSYCIECQGKAKKLKFEEKLETLIQIFGGACQDCNTSYPIPVYEFYSEKETFSPGRAKNMSLKRIIKDLEGYKMLCKNCSALRKWEKY